MIALRNKTVAHTFPPSFDSANGRPCQERLLRSRSWFCHHGNVTSHFSFLQRSLLAACGSLTLTLPTWHHGRPSLGFFNPVIPTVILNMPFNGQICSWTEYSLCLQSTEWQNVDIVSLNERCLERVSKLSDVSFFSASGLPNFRCPIPVSLL